MSNPIRLASEIAILEMLGAETALAASVIAIVELSPPVYNGAYSVILIAEVGEIEGPPPSGAERYGPRVQCM
jgi:hypothetical protein